MKIHNDVVRVIFSSVIFLFSILLSSCNAEKADEEKIILTQFPGYHILNIKDLDIMTSDYFQKKISGLVPGIVKADLDGNGYKDIAVLLRADSAETTKLVILLCSSSAQCAVSYEVDVSRHYDAVYLTPVKSGSQISQTESIDVKNLMSPIKLIHPGIRLTYLGKAQIVLYWDDKLKKITSIQTAD